jgi:hypothetical protein
MQLLNLPSNDRLPETFLGKYPSVKVLKCGRYVDRAQK